MYAMPDVRPCRWARCSVELGVLPEQGFGVRIEDEVIVTATGYRLLTADFPRKLEDVEAWIAKARR
jgi:hypothetical protein